ncbi:hypothetical protein AB0I72_21720 [Nocardiopsis sp. NPDC049922]|uniref:hypothetical protein n=1 Tax=Nocardiopsis sp. NPDC049922 TaxID=3155157 RepID=UPI0033D93C85
MTSKNTNPAVKPKRRTFTTAYKLDIVTADDACTSGTKRGILLRREGLHHSHIAE